MYLRFRKPHFFCKQMTDGLISRKNETENTSSLLGNRGFMTYPRLVYPLLISLALLRFLRKTFVFFRKIVVYSKTFRIVRHYWIYFLFLFHFFLQTTKYAFKFFCYQSQRYMYFLFFQKKNRLFYENRYIETRTINTNLYCSKSKVTSSPISVKGAHCRTLEKSFSLIHFIAL